jgi:hypothetical protein
MLLILTTVAVVFLVWVPVASAWSWPVRGPVLQPFLYDEAHPYDAGQHRGIDIGASASGDPVVAPESGTVSFAGFVPTSGQSLTIETAGGYSVTLTHLGSIGVATGAAVSEGDVVATVGPSGAPEQSVPYVHLGIRLTTDPLGYVDPLGLLPAPESPPPPPTPAPTPVPQPVAKAVPAPTHVRGGGLVIEKPAVAPPAVAAPAEHPHASAPKPEPKPVSHPHSQPRPAPTADTFRTDVPPIRRPLPQPRQIPVPVATRTFAPPPVFAAAGLGAGLAVLATLFLVRRRRGTMAAEPALVSWTDALLFDDADLLRERDAEHRQRVHDRDRGHPRPPSEAARCRHVLSDRGRRARDEGLARRPRAGPRGAGLRRPHRCAVA